MNDYLSLEIIPDKRPQTVTPSRIQAQWLYKNKLSMVLKICVYRPCLICLSTKIMLLRSLQKWAWGCLAFLKIG